MKRNDIAIAALRLVSPIFGWRYGQAILDRVNAAVCFLMGVGSGMDVAHSREAKIARLLPIRKDGVFRVFDVGANVGEYAIETMAIDVPGSEVVCFEPSPDAFASLQRNVSRFGNRITCEPFALSDKEGEATLYSNTPGSRLSSLYQRRLGPSLLFTTQVHIRLTTIDAYCAKMGIKRIDLLKLDVEGHEIAALKGATKMLSRGAITAIAFEFGGCNIDSRTYLRDFFELLEPYSFEFYRLTASGYAHRLPSYSERFEQFRTTNFLALRETADE